MTLHKCEVIRESFAPDYGIKSAAKRRLERLGVEVRLGAPVTAIQKRTSDALPKQVQRVFEEGRALVLEAKGLGRAKPVGG
jgi:hypothetical protein